MQVGSNRWFQKTIRLAARKRGCHLVTDEIISQINELSVIEIGLINIFLMHTSASLTINENADRDVRSDMEQALNQIVPETQPFNHSLEGPDDMPAHVKSSLLGCSLTVPVSCGRLVLGTWQGLYLCEHRNNGGPRSLVVTVSGWTNGT